MTSDSARHAAPAARRPAAGRAGARRAPRRRVHRRLSAGSVLIAFALVAVFSLAPPPPPSAADVLEAYIYAHAQTLTVTGGAVTDINRDAMTASLGSADLAGSTNYDWARLVLALGGWPATTDSVNTLVRWMRQENGANNWWNRNNPLNNGWGSGGGGGTGTYPSLLVAAQNAAAALHKVPGYAPIIKALAASAPDTVIEKAIWASPWSTSHYANGTHWSHVPVPEYKSPAGTW